MGGKKSQGITKLMYLSKFTELKIARSWETVCGSFLAVILVGFSLCPLLETKYWLR